MAIDQTTLGESCGESAGDLTATAMPGITGTGRRPRLAEPGTRRRPRSRVAKAAAIAVPAALTLAAGGAAHAAATRQASPATAHRGQASQAPGLGVRARPAAATFTWHKLALRNGWKSSPAALHSGSPSWAISNGVVYLSGALRLPAGTSKQFAVLPRAARPAHRMFVKVYTAGGTTGILQLSRNGAMLASSSPAGNARTFVSLAAVSFPAAAFQWHTLTLLNGWKSTAGSLQTGDPSYAVKAGVVYLSGGLRGGTTNFFAALPAAARPAKTMYRSVDTATGAWGALVIETDGNMFAYGNPQSDAQNFTSLAAVSFTARTVRPHKLTLINGWKPGAASGGTGGPGYAVKGGVVYLSGALRQAPGFTSQQFAVLPPAARPSHVLRITVWVAAFDTGAITIDPNGQAFATSLAGNGRNLTSLAAVSYPRSS